MPIPLRLDVNIRQTGIEVFGLLQQGLMAVGQTAATKTSAGLAKVAGSLQGLLPTITGLPVELNFITAALETLSRQSGTVAPATLDILANRLEALRFSLIRSRFPMLDLKEATGMLLKEDWLLQHALDQATNALRTQATALQTTERVATGASVATDRVKTSTQGATAANRDWRRSSTQAMTAMNIQSSAAAGLMMANSLLSGSITGLGFSFIFLRFSIAPITLGVAALAVVLGGMFKMLGKFAKEFETDIQGPLSRIKTAFGDAFRGLGAPIILEVFVPILKAVADLADKIHILGLRAFTSEEFQAKLADTIANSQGLVEKLSELWTEHGDILDWIVKTIYSGTLDVINLTINAIELMIDLLPILVDSWRAVADILGEVTPLFELLGIAMDEINLSEATDRALEFSLRFPENIDTALATAILVIQKGKIGLLGILISLVGDILIEMLPLEEGVKKIWHDTWDWAVLGAAIGAGAGPIGLAIGALTGTILALLNEHLKGGVVRWFKERFVQVLFGALIGAVIAGGLLALGPVAAAIGAIVGGIVIALADAMHNSKEEIIYWFKVTLPEWIKDSVEAASEDCNAWIDKYFGPGVAGAILDGIISSLTNIKNDIANFFKTVLKEYIIGGLKVMKKDIEDWIDRNLKHSIHVGAIPIHMTLVPVLGGGGTPKMDWAPLSKAMTYSLNRPAGGAFGTSAATPTVSVSVFGNLFLDQETADKLSTVVEKRIVGRLSTLYGRGLA